MSEKKNIKWGNNTFFAKYFKATLAEGNLGHGDLGTWRTLAWGLQDTWDSGGMGIRDLVTWTCRTMDWVGTW